MTVSRIVTSVAVASFLLLGCTAQERDDMVYKAQNSVKQDRDLNYDRDQFRNAMEPRPIDQKNDSFANAPVPDLAPVIAEDKKNILPQPLVSITVNQDVPLRDIFFELAKQAEVDLELDPTITGSIIFTAYNRPFDQVVERIADVAGLRYSFKNNVLRVERDTPYIKNYKVDYLNLTRNYSSTINSNTSAASATGSGGGSGGNGSSGTITTTSWANFWDELRRNLNQIITNTNQQVTLTDQSTPVLSTASAIPAVSTDQLATVNAPNANGTTPPPAGTATPAPAAPATTGTASPSITVNLASGTAPAATLANPAGAQTAGTSQTTEIETDSPYFSINRQAGIITIFATQKQHQKIAAYLDEMRKTVNTQILIEAKVFEVELNDENSTGINWTALLGSGPGSLGEKVGFGVNFEPATFPTDPLAPGNTGVFNFSDSDFNLVINALNRFGNVRTLSSPRLTVMNNQTAVLNVSESRVFFTFEIDNIEATVNSPARREIESQVHNVPEGLIMTVHPSVDTDTGEITMNLRPSLTRVVRSVSDPATRIASGGDIESFIPELSVREIDSVVKMQSGSTMVMGGLMQDRTDSQQVGVPVLSETPVVGPLFRNQRDAVRKTEMVIMLRAKIVNQPEPDKTDKEMYKEMAKDRHPLDY